MEEEEEEEKKESAQVLRFFVSHWNEFSSLLILGQEHLVSWLQEFVDLGLQRSRARGRSSVGTSSCDHGRALWNGSSS